MHPDLSTAISQALHALESVADEMQPQLARDGGGEAKALVPETVETVLAALEVLQAAREKQRHMGARCEACGSEDVAFFDRGES